MARFDALSAIALAAVAAATNAHACGPFYEAPPPTLDYYLKQVPAKSFGEILGQTPSSAEPLAIGDAVADLAKKFLQVPAADRVKLVDSYLAKARAGKSNDTDLNLLESLRDAAGSGAAASELQTYTQWRLDNDSWFVGGNSGDDNMKVLNNSFTSASPALKPCWLYLTGALFFRGGNTVDAENCFDRVLKDYKSSPAAEMALYMKARCAFARAHSDTPQKTDSGTAHALFQQYIAAYPQGRFIADAWGWLGGLERDDALALVDFARQAENTNHPEVFASAENEVARIFDNLDYEDGDKGFDEIAQHPELALALTYVAIHTVTTPLPADDSYSPPAPEDQAKLEKWRGIVLPKLAAAVVTHKNLYHGAEGEEVYLTILAHAASDHGDKEKALQLIGMVHSNRHASDDFLFVKGLVLQRSGKPEAAAQVYRSLIEAYPASGLVPGASYRLALSLHDLNRDWRRPAGTG